MKKAVNTRYVFNGLHVVHAMLGSHMYDQVNKIRKEYRRYWKDILINSHITRKINSNTFFAPFSSFVSKGESKTRLDC